jgi:hypothetical protein
MPYNSFALRMLAIIPVLASAPAINADCLPSVPGGWEVPYTMTVHSNRGLVGYTKGTLSTSYSWGTRSFQGYNAPQLFSDRFVPPPPGSFGSQPFDVNQADHNDLRISESILIGPPAINIVLTIHPWNATYTFQGSCDASTNLLYGNVNHDTFVVVSFGTPFHLQ